MRERYDGMYQYSGAIEGKRWEKLTMPDLR
jgi:hypothetical protein